MAAADPSRVTMPGRRDVRRFMGHSRATRVLTLVILTALALAGWLGASSLGRLAHGWFDKDLRARAVLVVSGARAGLADRWSAGDPRLQQMLEAIARDERVIGAIACGADNATLARTADMPVELTCRRIASAAGAADGHVGEWQDDLVLSGGRVFCSVFPLDPAAPERGFVTLVQDVGWAELRASRARRFVDLGIGFVAVLFLVLAGFAPGLWYRSLRAQLRRLLRAKSTDHFSPLIQDMRALVQQLANERDAEGGGAAWDAARLRRTLRQHLDGERMMIMSNREPYIHERDGNGGTVVKHPASGLVTALEPVMRACSGVWIAHGSGSADRQLADSRGRVAVPPNDPAYTLRRVWLSAEEERGYYYGFANEGLWPLCHVAHTRPIFRRDDFDAYARVNARFAAAACDEAEQSDPIVLVQDYHLALAPRMLRERLPRALVLTFWHIPWTNAEQFGICPYRKPILEGLLGSDIVGFHTPFHCNNFLDAVERYLEARVLREEQVVIFNGHRTLVRSYPISVEWPSSRLGEMPPIAECRADVRRALGLPADTVMGIGVDRLDYTKGIEERLLAVERLLEERPGLRGRFTFVQVAAPSRSLLERYRETAERVERIATRVNQRFAGGAAPPIVLLREHHEPAQVFRFYRAADLCYVSSLHDGMNLVAKEFVAARDDDDGVLLLSRFAGAARELAEALVVNPYDVDEAAAALAAAIDMPRAERRVRMSAMRAYVAHFNVFRWAGRMLIDAAGLRRRQRVPVRTRVDRALRWGGAR